jgi:hypothetical protein
MIRRPTCRQRLAEAIKQRDDASKSNLLLIAELESMMDRFKRAILDSGAVADKEMAEIAVSPGRRLIDKVRKGR